MVFDWSNSPITGGSPPISPVSLGDGPQVYLDCSSPRYRSYFLASPITMSGDNQGKGKAKAPTTSSSTGPPQLSFVTATNLNDFKNKDTMRQVRKTVMHSYLSKASDDPESKDVRVKNRRQGGRVRRTPTETPAVPATSAVPPPQPSASPSLRRDSHAEDAGMFRMDQYESYPTPGASSATSTYTQAFPGISGLEEPLIHPPPQASPPAAQVPQNASRRALEEAADRMNCEPYMLHIAEARNFLMAYTQAQDKKNRENQTDPFAQCDPLPTTLNISLLKGNCKWLSRLCFVLCTDSL